MALAQLELDRASGRITQDEYASTKANLEEAHHVATRPWRIGFLIMVLVPVLFIGGCFALVFSGGDGVASEESNQAAVIVKCHNEVKNLLKSPKSADFSGDVATSTGRPGTYTVTGSVDAENSFGASVRTRWTCAGSATNGYATAVATATLAE